MNVPCLLRTSVALVICLFLVLPTFPQTGGRIGPSNGEIIGIIVGAAAAITVVGILIYREAHKHPSITGRVATSADGLNLMNEKDKKVYTLSGDSSALRAGDRVTLKGKKIKDSGGKPSFQVEKLTKDYGTCNP
ncbi:MAG: hypothetical protein WBR10_14975 [Candidatus Acidiferrum sp.]